MKTSWLIVAGILAAAAASNALSEQYPIKPIRMLTPFPPGGGTDQLARVIAEPMSEVFGQPVVVDNRGGAGGAIGAEIAARAEPDGYTFILVSSSYSATSVYSKTPYDPVNGIEPVVLIGTTGVLMSVNPSLPVKSVAELIQLAQEKPGKLNYASVGVGSVPHLAMELLKQMTNINMVHIPYRGAGPALIALIADESQVGMISVVPSIPHLKAGRLRAIAVTTGERMSLLPDVPSISETLPGFVVNHWYGVWGPKGIPKPIVLRWNRALSKSLQSEEMMKRLRLEGLEPAGGPPDQLRQIIRRDVERWTGVVRKANIKTQRQVRS